MMKSGFLFLLMFLTLFAFSEDVGAPVGEPINGIVATVNNGVITRLDLDTATDQALESLKAQGSALPERAIVEHQVLASLINQKIALELVELNKITVSDQDVAAAILKIAASNALSVPALYTKLSAQGLTKTTYEDMIKKQLLINQLEQGAISGSITVTPAEIDRALAQTKRLGDTNTLFDVAHILISLPDNPTPGDIAKAKAKATLVVKKINAGLSFETAAMTYSDSDDALKGGDLGYRPLNQLPTLFVNLVPTLSVGEVSSPLQADNGFHIITLLGKKGGDDTTVHFVTQYHVLAILIKATPIKNDTDVKAQLMRIKASLDNGVDFASLAKDNSQDLTSAENGGDLGWVMISHVNPVLGNQITQTPVGSVSAPFKTSDGWYLIKVLGTKKVDDTTAYLRDAAMQTLFQEKAQNALMAWQSQIRAASYVNILDPTLQ